MVAGSASDIASVFWGAKPGLQPQKLRISKPALMSTTSASAISSTTSVLRIQAREPPVPVRPPSQGLVQIGLRSLKRGNEAEDDAGQQRNAERERKARQSTPISLTRGI